MSADKEEIKPDDVARFDELATRLNTLLTFISTYCPGVNLYVEGGYFHLMTGPSHDRGEEHPRHDRIVTSVLVTRSGGGDW